MMPVHLLHKQSKRSLLDILLTRYLFTQYPMRSTNTLRTICDRQTDSFGWSLTMPLPRSNGLSTDISVYRGRCSLHHLSTVALIFQVTTAGSLSFARFLSLHLAISKFPLVCIVRAVRV